MWRRGRAVQRPQAQRDTETREEGSLCQASQEGSAVVPPDQWIPLSGRYVVIDLQGGGLPGS